jgi:hypothetical protein
LRRIGTRSGLRRRATVFCDEPTVQMRSYRFEQNDYLHRGPLRVGTME